MDPDSPPTAHIYRPNVTALQRVLFTIIVRLMKIFGSLFLKVRVFHHAKSARPTLTKSYPKQPNLTHRVFIPKSYKSGDPPLPLFLDLHGGGFVFLNPSLDDKLCSTLANKHHILCVSMAYPLAPAHKYPAAVRSVADTVNAILEDKNLPIDTSKVAIGGGSAGGNLACAVGQLDSTKGKIKGIVALYPPVKFDSGVEERKATRPSYAPRNDALEGMVKMFDTSYIPEGQDLTDPKLSVYYANRADLPPKMYFVGCDLDMLCRDAELLALKLAKTGGGARSGSDDVWEQNGIKWERFMGQPHG